MKVLILNWRDIRSPEAGGAEVHLHEIATRLVQYGHEVTLIVSRFASKSCAREESIDGIRVLRVGSWWNAHVTIPKAARRLLDSEPFDVLLDDVNKIPFFAPKWSKVPVVALFLHLLGETVFLETSWLAATLIRNLERQIGRTYAGASCIAISACTAEDVSESGIPRSSIHVIHPGLDHGTFAPDGTPKSDSPLILVVSRLKAYKRIETAILAFKSILAALPKAELVIIGSGNHEQRLRRIASTARVPAKFVGSIPESEKVDWLRRAHLTLLPSMKEGFGLVAIESMACGTPVVATDVHGHRDSICEGAGALVPMNDPLEMAQAALRYLTNPELYAEAKCAGINWARRFDWDQCAKEVERVLKLAICGADQHETSMEMEPVR